MDSNHGGSLAFVQPDNEYVLKYFITQSTVIPSRTDCEQWLLGLHNKRIDLNKIEILVKGYEASCPQLEEKVMGFLQNIDSLKEHILDNKASRTRNYSQIEAKKYIPISIDRKIRGTGTIALLDLIDYLLHEDEDAIDLEYIAEVISKYNVSDLSHKVSSNVSPIKQYPDRFMGFLPLTEKQQQQRRTIHEWISKQSDDLTKTSVVNFSHQLRLIDEEHKQEQCLESRINETMPRASMRSAEVPSVDSPILLRSEDSEITVSSTIIVPESSDDMNPEADQEESERDLHGEPASLPVQTGEVIPPNSVKCELPSDINTGFLLKCLSAGLITCALVVLILTASPAIVAILPFSVQSLQYAAYASVAAGSLGLFAQRISISQAPTDGAREYPQI